MSMPPVWAFEFDDANEAEFAGHGIYPEQILQVLSNPHRIEANRRRRRATHRMIGLDAGGRWLTIPIEPTHERGVWRPVTAWPSSMAERGRFGR